MRASWWSWGRGVPAESGRPGRALALTDRGPAASVRRSAWTISPSALSICADRCASVRPQEAPNRDVAPRPYCARLGTLLESVTADAGAAGLRPAGLAVAVPGLVARSSTTVVRAPNLGWHDTDIAAHLTGPLRLTVDNEANFGALAELWLGGDDSAPGDFIHVSAEVGIGAAIVLDGELLRGRRGFAGELGHVPVEPDGPRCPCGGSGCLEQYAGEAAVLRAAGIDAPGTGGRSAALATLRAHAESGESDALEALRPCGQSTGYRARGRSEPPRSQGRAPRRRTRRTCALASARAGGGVGAAHGGAWRGAGARGLGARRRGPVAGCGTFRRTDSAERPAAVRRCSLTAAQARTPSARRRPVRKTSRGGSWPFNQHPWKIQHFGRLPDGCRAVLLRGRTCSIV